MNRFSDFVRSEPPSAPQLPLMHSCEAFYFRAIIDRKELTTTPCNVFDGEHLVYFFYGRPAYRPSKGQTASSHPAFMPICIVLDPYTIANPKRIAPFDTGAFHEGLFEDHLHPDMSCEDFLLETSLDMPARLVGKFFGSNEKYYLGEPFTIEIPPIQFEAISYYDLIRVRGKTIYDDRRSAIEIQFDQSLQLTQNNVLLVVLPTVFMDMIEIRNTILSEWSAEFRTYNIHHCNPGEYLSLVYREVEEFLREGKYFQK